MKEAIKIGCLLIIATVGINGCSQHVVIEKNKSTEQKLDIIESDAKQKILVTKDEDFYYLYVQRSNDPSPKLILKSIKPVSFPRLSENEEVTVYVSEETGSPMIFAQELGSGMRKMAATIDNELDKLEFTNSSYEVIYQYKNGEIFYINIDQIFTKISR